MTTDLSAPVQEVAEKINSDKGWQAKMMRVVNCAFTGLASPASDVAQAISLLGYKKVCNLAVSISIIDLFPKQQEGGFDYGRFWERAVVCGVSAGEIAHRMPGDFPGEPFSAGVLQDLGVLFLIKNRPMDYGMALGIARNKGVPIVVAEQEAMGTDHAAIGAQLAKKWQVPAQMVELIRYSHFYESKLDIPAGTKTVIQTVNLSSLVADVLLDTHDDARKILNERAAEFFGLGPKNIDDLLTKVPDQVDEVLKSFAIEVVSAAAAPAQPEAPLLDKCPDCGAEGSGRFCSECGGTLAKEKPQKPRSKTKVLIAEDSIASRRALCFVIKKLGYVPVEATNGFEAVELAKKDPPGMIMLDVMMPRMNGLEALKRIRGEESTADIPVVMLTSLTDSETVVEAVQAGADDYVVKPYTADIISQRLKKYMPKKERK